VYADFSRVLDQPLDGCSGVLAEQGRFLVDAEINEQNAIVLGYLLRLMTDLVGPFAGPAHRCGFAVTRTVSAGDVCAAVELSAGRYYVHGLRCEVPAPFHPTGALAAVSPALAAPFIVHLGAWEQTISVIQAPELLDPRTSFTGSRSTSRDRAARRPSNGRARTEASSSGSRSTAGLTRSRTRGAIQARCRRSSSGVELVDDDWAPFGSPGPLLQIASLSGSTVTFLTPPPPSVAILAARHPTLR
jgi:hypothetical protein